MHSLLVARNENALKPGPIHQGKKTGKKPRVARASASGSAPSGSRVTATSSSSKARINGTSKGRPTSSKSGAASSSKRAREDEELGSDSDSGLGSSDRGGVDDADELEDAEEDPEETPAEKRLRLARLYLEQVGREEGGRTGELAEHEFDAADADRELIDARLRREVREGSGKVHVFIADSLDIPVASTSGTQSTYYRSTMLKGHRLSVTAAVLSEDARTLFSAGKEGSIIEWDVQTRKRRRTFAKQRASKSDRRKWAAEATGHTDEILALALSLDGTCLVSGGRDRRVGVWDVARSRTSASTGSSSVATKTPAITSVQASQGLVPQSGAGRKGAQADGSAQAWLKGFGGHKDSIYALAFRKGTRQLYSASADRTVRVYDFSPNTMGYVETLFGHQDTVLGIDALRAETCVTVGGRDRTARFWKVVEESQLVFRGGGRSKVRDLLEGGPLEGLDDDPHAASKKNVQPNGKSTETRYVEGSLDCLCALDDAHFLTGGDSGSIALWTTAKKKPVFSQALAHGLHEMLSGTEGILRNPRGITSLGCVRYGDVFASGSWEGAIRLWKLEQQSSPRSFSLLGQIPAPGVVNSLQLLVPPKNHSLAHAAWIRTSDERGGANGAGLGRDDGDEGSDAEDDHPGAEAGAVARNEAMDVALLLVAGMGQEPRLGRWMRVTEGGATNGALVVALRKRDATT